MPKKIERGDSLVSPGLVCYAEKQVKPFWFSSLDQIVHFGAIIFCRTFVELFWSVRVDRKKNQSRMCGKGVGLGIFSEVEKWPFF